MFDVEKLIRPNIRKFEPYRCARDDFSTGILLDANENTYGTALEQMTKGEEELELNRYPDPHQVEVKQRIADFRNKAPSPLWNEKGELLGVENLCLGVGSDESIDLLMRCTCTPGKDKLLICKPTYGMYSICAAMNDVHIVDVPLTYPGFQLDVEKVLDTIKQDPSIKLIYLTSPGNPTGALINPSDIAFLLENAASIWNGLIVVDEAYIDFCKTPENASISTLVNQYPNLVVFQTLSKSFGLAGIRLGITMSNRSISYYLNAVKYPYNISSLTSGVAARATSSAGLVKMRRHVELIISERLRLLSELEKIQGVWKNIGGLQANFILIQILDSNGEPSNETAFELYKTLAELNGVVVRFRGKELYCEGCLRISIGTYEENNYLLENMKKRLEDIYRH